MNPVAEKIKELIQNTLPDSRVHIGRPFINHDQDIIDQLINDFKKIDCWTIERTAVQETPHSTSRLFQETTWTLEGYLAIDQADANYPIINNSIDALRLAFRKNDNLDGVVATLTTATAVGLQLDQLDYVWLFNKNLCHRAQLTLKTQEFTNHG